MSWFNNSSLFEKVCAAAFVFLATISCFATAQSLTLTLGLDFLPSWLIFLLLFILAIFVYILTAYCFKKIIDSHNDEYCASVHKTISDRKKMFWGGVLGVFFFWIICSLPTNTHSMLHMKVAKNVAIAELDNQLQVFKKATITDKNTLYNEHYKDSVDMRSYFRKEKDALDFEVKRHDDEGFGKRARAIVNEVQSRYKDEIKKLSFVFENHLDRGGNLTDYQILDFYKDQFDKLANQLANDMYSDYIIRQNNLDVETADLQKKIERIESTIDRLKRRGSVIGDAKDVIDDGYNQSSYRVTLLDNIETLKDPSKGHEPQNVKKYEKYRIDRLYSVFNVWGDFFSGKLPKEFDMLYWIIWAAILDIAALIFSGIAFRGKSNKKNNYN